MLTYVLIYVDFFAGATSPIGTLTIKSRGGLKRGKRGKRGLAEFPRFSKSYVQNTKTRKY